MPKHCGMRIGSEKKSRLLEAARTARLKKRLKGVKDESRPAKSAERRPAQALGGDPDRSARDISKKAMGKIQKN